MRKLKIGIALSGGGARGIAHLGVLQALFEKNIYPDIIAGISAGAIVGVFIADGYSPGEIFEFIKDKKIFNFTKIQIPKQGLLSLHGLVDILNSKIRARNLEDLKIPLVIGASNLNTGKIEYFEKGPVNLLIQASSSIPILFSPVKIGEYLYADGGIFENLPASPIRKRCKKLIGVHVNPIQYSEDLDNLIKIATRTFYLTVNETIKASKKLCNHFIEPDELWKYEILSVKKADELFKVGYEYCRKMKIKP